MDLNTILVDQTTFGKFSNKDSRIKYVVLWIQYNSIQFWTKNPEISCQFDMTENQNSKQGF